MRYKGLFALVCSLTIIFFLPQILSTSMGKSFISKVIEKKLRSNSEVSINHLSLSWLGKQSAKKIEVKQANTSIHIDEIESQDSLFYLAFGTPRYKLSGRVLDDKKVGLIDIEVTESKTKGNFQGIPSRTLEIIFNDELNLLTKSVGKEFSINWSVVNGKLIGGIRSPNLQGTVSGIKGSSVHVHSQVYRGLLSDILGKEFDLQMNFRQFLEVKISSNKFSSDDFHIDLNRSMKLLNPVDIDLSLPPTFIGNLYGIEEVYTSEIPLKIHLEALNNIELRSKGFQLFSHSSFGDFLVKAFNMHLQPKNKLNGKLGIKPIDSEEPFSQVDFSENRVEVRGPRGSFIADNIINRKGMISANASFNYNDKQLFQELSIIEPSLLPQKFSGQFETIKVPLSGDMSKLVVNGHLNMNILEQTQVNIAVNGPKNQIDFDLQSSSFMSNANKMHLSLTHWIANQKIDLEKLQLEGDIDFNALPVSQLERFFNLPGLSDLIGNQLTIQAKTQIDYFQQKSGELEFHVKGDQFQSNGSLVIEDTIHLKNANKPVMIDWTMTPSRFKTLRKMGGTNDSLALNRSTAVIISLSEISVPWLQKSSEGGWHLLPKNDLGIIDSAFLGKIAIKDLSLIDKISGNKSEFSTVEGKVSTHDLFQALAFELSILGNKSKVFAKGLAEHLFNEEGKINVEGLSVGLEAKAENAPVSLFADALLLDNKLRNQTNALIGSRLNGEISIDYRMGNGPVKASVEGDHGKLYLDGKVTDGILTLNSPFSAEVMVTEQLGSSVLKDIVPLLSTAVSGEKPIKITISKEKFSFPIHRWNVSNAYIGSGVIDLGKVDLKFGSELEQILFLLNYSHEGSSTVFAWFTPLYFSMSQGVISIQRIDILLANYYPLAMWGKIDYQSDKVKMTLGISSIALKNAFGVKGFPKKTLLQLPIKGRLADARVDTKKAAVKVTSLVAHAKGGPEGVVIGSLIDILSGNHGDKSPPKQTTAPFPWEVSQLE